VGDKTMKQYEIKNISNTNVGLVKVLIKKGQTRIVDEDKITDSVKTMESNGLITISEYSRKGKTEAAEEYTEKEQALKDASDEILDGLEHKKKVNTVDKLVQGPKGEVLGYKPAEEDSNVSENKDFDAKVESDNSEKAEEKVEEKSEEDAKEPEEDKVEESKEESGHTAESLKGLKVAQLRKIGDELGVKGKNKEELIKNILSK
jgi:FtsZ-interacting cell division protein ZipA